MAETLMETFISVLEPLVSPSNFEQVPNTTLTAKSGQFQWDAVDPSPETMRGEFRGYRVIKHADTYKGHLKKI